MVDYKLSEYLKASEEQKKEMEAEILRKENEEVTKQKIVNSEQFKTLAKRFLELERISITVPTELCVEIENEDKDLDPYFFIAKREVLAKTIASTATYKNAVQQIKITMEKMIDLWKPITKDKKRAKGEIENYILSQDPKIFSELT